MSRGVWEAWPCAECGVKSMGRLSDVHYLIVVGCYDMHGFGVSMPPFSVVECESLNEVPTLLKMGSKRNTKIPLQVYWHSLCGILGQLCTIPVSNSHTVLTKHHDAQD